MLYFFWWLLGCLLALHFIYTCIQLLGLIKNKLGWGSTAILVIGFISFAGNDSHENTSVSREAKKWTFEADSSVQSLRHKSVRIEKKSLLGIKLYAVYGFKDDKQVLIPVSATSTTEGITGGVKWIPHDISLVADSTGKKLNYSVSGILEWRLMNLTLYYQSKTYAGEFTINDNQ